ncbi:multiple sugar transport system permease protein [Gracilibacillus ureilyticus]|uniref:Multiple sugar transport system permease protein n=1 Tax=Gracilibacillus ureilyticus TaxID=531814 RepID=A0A1H9UU53_9BACI|nr:sugar ABC transporter permease [Gracilibacillus ureilyticus]SES12674.1 multiple sugar transport system permease protein [Gracilibacillus ureilyticus]
MQRTNKMTYIFLIPTIIVFLVLTVYPLLYVITASFFSMNYLQGTEWKFVGFQGYQELFQDSLFWVAFKNTIIFVVIAVSLEVFFGLMFAILFQKNFKGSAIIRSIVLLPMLLPPITVALTWKMMYEYDYGIINYFLTLVGLPAIEWLSSADWALFSIVITDVWQWTPFAFLIILASLQTIPKDLYESAAVNGASGFQAFRYITLPLLKPVILLVLFLRTIDTFQIFDKMYVLTGGGPGNATETLTFYIYRQGFRYFETGYATAATLVVVIIIVILSIGYIKSVYKSAYSR